MHIDRTKVESHLKESEISGPSGKIIAWTFTSPKSNPETRKVHVLFFHGNAENVSSHFYSLYWLMDQGYNFTIFDYPGYGGSEGEPNQNTTTDASRIVLDSLHTTYPDTQFLIFGQSLGGNIALYTASERSINHRLCGVIIESGFLSYKMIARRILARHWSTWLLQPLAYVLISESYSAKNSIQKLSPLPLLVMHDKNDPVVDFANGQDIFEAAPGPKEFVDMDSTGHAGAFSSSDRIKYQNLFVRFIQENCQNYKKPSF